MKEKEGKKTFFGCILVTLSIMAVLAALMTPAVLRIMENKIRWYTKNIADGVYTGAELQKYVVSDNTNVTLVNEDNNTIINIKNGDVITLTSNMNMVELIAREIKHTDEELIDIKFDVKRNDKDSITLKFNTKRNVESVALENTELNEYNGKYVVTDILNGNLRYGGDNIYYIERDKVDCSETEVIELSTEVKDTSIEYMLCEVRDASTSKLLFYKAIPVTESRHTER